MKPQMKIVLTFLLILVLTTSFYVVSKKISSLTGKGISETTKSELDDFAKCLTGKGVKLYVGEGCELCDTQKRYFGSSVEYLNVIDCSENTCEQLKEMPAWEINGEIYYGIKSLKELIEISGCEF